MCRQVTGEEQAHLIGIVRLFVGPVCEQAVLEFKEAPLPLGVDFAHLLQITEFEHLLGVCVRRTPRLRRRLLQMSRSSTAR